MVNAEGQHVIAGRPVKIGIAVFCGTVLSVKEETRNEIPVRLITLDDSTGIYNFVDVNRLVKVEIGHKVKVFGKIRLNKNGKTIVIVNVIRKIDNQFPSVMSCFMLEAINTVMFEEKIVKEEPKKSPPKIFTSNEFSQRTSGVLSVVINNENEQGANVFHDFKALDLDEMDLRIILSELSNNGIQKFNSKKVIIKDISTAP
ncbi:Oidioi.mRNA.OKI2018_I69.chr2.g4865.t1.cds [Oikopleura dioica]|uniref:Oidioi.mRNA.OKI2018_I69.chr2.g4865.t1.cds n=1 Tax=Oikopleura dioica TaxID=34765 RepID=A0ABN7T089_OIKDI|nr:Oidioi.mRNA.OKI2018_I69.chr2.g4865.t1.cds [Oikopleura dioica]